MTDAMLGDLPNATYEHVAGDVATEEVWRLHVMRKAMAVLPAALRETVEVDGEEVHRLRAEEIEDVGLLIHYEVD